MRRGTAHLLFAAAASLCLVAMAIQALQLRHAVETRRAIAFAAQWAAHPPADLPVDDRQISLARAVALSNAGNSDAALHLFNALAMPEARDEIARAALFDTGNLYLRQGLRQAANPAVFLPMLELAKQRYREVLRLDPGDWDARFNLERTLRYAPEDKEAFEQPDAQPVERPPNKLPELLAPDLP